MMKNLNSRGLRLAITTALLAGSLNAAAEAGDILVRLRGIVVAPDDSSTNITVAGVGVDAPSGVGVNNAVTPEADITYMITRNIGVEAIAGTAHHTVNIHSAPPSVLNTLGLTGIDIFKTWVLPPTVTVQYHFMPESKFRPYVGAGVNYTVFLAEDATSTLESAVGSVDVDMDNSWGWAAQAGFDYTIKDNWFVNFDVKYISISSRATLNLKNPAAPTSRVHVDVDVDPWVIGAGIGYRF